MNQNQKFTSVVNIKKRMYQRKYKYQHTGEQTAWQHVSASQ
jgi:hypothetical protein